MTKRNNYFKTFCKISKAFGTTLGKEKLLDLIVHSAIDTMDAKAACLFLADEEKDVFIPMAQKGLSENYLHASPIRAKKIVDEILKGGYLKFYDATTDSRLENLEAKKTEGIASILSVPVLVKDKAIGILSLYTGEPRDFSQDEIDFLTALAEQGGIAIGQARLFERINQNSTLFLNLASSINSTLDIKKILHILSAEICEALNMKGVAIRLLNNETGNLELVASYGLNEEFINKGPVSAEKSISQVLKGETIIVEDVATDDRIEYREETLKEGIASILCVPIKSREEVIGVMKLYSDAVRKYPQDVIILVNALAHTGGLAIQNASMYLSLQEDKKSLEEDIWSHRSWF
ncbi:MAG: GAF domain-containing protein [Deltaproteobacteria bacterium]|jgi:GAF domain-containing protein|nr:GAF domain-containing protein [Deltaproteobacteria bacterium]MBW1826142.1 GAF domain-containing protein [Deltaproteobacteria bacterium]MBW1969652.1 GAF domain-containing protein [Deltaproteobacteria bacterium]MBW2156048.1 GAF domain-containing protein [Deltaproteobacteria bacterium]MBW2197537.1 GAF domain-containing protein [Deltaproteobacteria bacterium]